jgi:anhydro-N-acetylmuramic acid kinase
VFHKPEAGVTSQLGEGAVIAAQTGINVISDLRAMDVALQGQGAPIVPMGEKLLLSEYSFLLNLGGIANITIQQNETYIAFDVCAANRVLNLLSNEAGKPYDEDGVMAASGTFVPELFQALNRLPYYEQPYPKSLANAFGVEVVYPLIQSFHLSVSDALRTYTEHIAYQITNAVKPFVEDVSEPQHTLLVTGGGAHNRYLIEVLEEFLKEYGIHVYVPETYLIDYKEALIMALLGVLRWREENTVLSSVTGALRDSIGGAVWLGQQA